MPKLSVSVPDDLWEAARRRSGEEYKPSQLVQTALQLYVTSGRRRAVKRAGEGEGQFERVLELLLEGREAEFRRGYEAGLDAAAILGFGVVEVFAGNEKNFNLVFTPNSSSFVGPEMEPLWPKERDYSDKSEFDRDIATLDAVGLDIRASKVFRDGALRAFNDLWAELEARVSDEDASELERAAADLGIGSGVDLEALGLGLDDDDV
jgi:hypothetical protein